MAFSNQRAALGEPKMKRTEKLIKAGWMIKSPPQGSITSILKSWEDRYFTLVQLTIVYSDEHWEVARFLRYYRTREDYVEAGLAKGEISLRDCLSATAHKPIKSYQNVIALESRNRTYYLCLASKEEQMEWLHVLQKNLPLTVQWQLAHRRQRDLEKKSHLSSAFLGRKKTVSRRRLSDVSSYTQSHVRNGRGRQRNNQDMKTQSVYIETKEEHLITESKRSLSVSMLLNQDTKFPLATNGENKKKEEFDRSISTGSLSSANQRVNQISNYDILQNTSKKLNLQSSSPVGKQSGESCSVHTDTDYVVMHDSVTNSVSSSFTRSGVLPDSRDRTSSTSSSDTEDVSALQLTKVGSIEGEDNGPRVAGQQSVLPGENRSNIYREDNGRMIKALSCGTLTLSPPTNSLFNSKEISVSITSEGPYVSMNHALSEEGNFQFNHSQCSHKVIRKIGSVSVEENKKADSLDSECSSPSFEPDGKRDSSHVVPKVVVQNSDPTSMETESKLLSKSVCDHNLNLTDISLDEQVYVGTGFRSTVSSSADDIDCGNLSKGTTIAGDRNNSIGIVQRQKSTSDYVDMSVNQPIPEVTEEDPSTTKRESYVDMTSYPMSILSDPFWQDNTIKVDLINE